MRSCIATAPGADQVRGQKSFNHMNPEISFFGTSDYREATIHPKFTSGDRLTTLLYTGHEILEKKPAISGMPSMDGGKTLVIHLYDDVKDFGADLYYTVYDDCDVIARRIVYFNNSDEDIKLDRAYSFAISLPHGDYDMLSAFTTFASV